MKGGTLCGFLVLFVGVLLAHNREYIEILVK